MAAGDLTDLPTARLAAGIDDPESTGSDGILSALITAVSAEVPGALQRNILSASYSEIYTGNGKSEMLLRQRPITAIASVAWAGQTITAAGDPITGVQGVWTDERNACLEGYSFPKGLPIRIGYTAGYAAIPADISLAVAQLVAEEFTRRQHVGESSRSANGVVTTSFDMRDMHPAIRRKLSNYMLGAPC
jgi:hypothetical protein